MNLCKTFNMDKYENLYTIKFIMLDQYPIEWFYQNINERDNQFQILISEYT